MSGTEDLRANAAKRFFLVATDAEPTAVRELCNGSESRLLRCADRSLAANLNVAWQHG